MSNNSPECETCALDLNVDSSHCESSSVSYIKSEKGSRFLIKKVSYAKFCIEK